MKSILINCKEATMLCTKQTEEALTFSEKLGLKIHLFICKPCLYFSKQLALVHKSLKNLVDKTPVSFTEKKKEQLQEKINEML